MQLQVNLNEKAQVILTKTGAEIYNKRVPEEFGPRHLEGTILVCPIWELFEIFGPEMYMGMPEVPFHQNEIML